MATNNEIENLQQLLETCARVADELQDGHFTIYKFTTGWKVVLGTPDMPLAEQEVLGDRLPGKMTLHDALLTFLRQPLELCEESEAGA